MKIIEFICGLLILTGLFCPVIYLAVAILTFGYFLYALLRYLSD